MFRGKYEKPLIAFLMSHFRSKGFETCAHAKLNIAWGKIISDVDVLAIKKKRIVAIEVKSNKDVFEKAFVQLDNLASFVDYAYIATDNLAKAECFKMLEHDYGIIYLDVDAKRVVVKKKAKRLKAMPSVEKLTHMRRCCLQELAKEFRVAPVQSKQYLALDLRRAATSSQLRSRLREIVTLNRCLHSRRVSYIN